MDAQQKAPQETFCHIALPQPLEQCLSNRAPLIWNSLPNELQEAGFCIFFWKALPETRENLRRYDQR